MSLCSVCEGLDLDPKRSIRWEQRLGEYNELLKKADRGCEACRFFCIILQNSSAWKGREVELSGRIVFLNSLRLDVREPEKVETSSWGSDDLLFDVCTSENYTDPDPEIDCRRTIPVNPLDDSCFNLIDSWLAECSEHSKCPNSMKTPLPKRIIEVPSDPTIAPRLFLPNGDIGSYVVLTHCWGGSSIMKLKASQIANFQEGIDVDLLPKNFADALTITRRLGFHYLWIDALCIIQDSAEDWAEESPKMASIYGQAALMISATAAENCHSGILNDRHVHYSPALGREKNRYLRLRLLRWDWDVDYSPLAKRGWAAQERILAPRTVHFTERQMIWECASKWQFEASAIVDKRRGSGQIRQRYQKEVVQPMVTKALGHQQDNGMRQEYSNKQGEGGTRQTRNKNKSNNDAETHELIERREVWHQCVDEFSKRSLTVPSDKLPAMAGLAAVINDGTVGDYLAGIWSKNIGFGLAWARVYALLIPTPVYRAPSWSWACIDGTFSSLLLSWPPTLMDDHARDPGWIERYGPKLIEHHMILQDPLNPYMGVLEGSYIVIEGACASISQLTEHLKDNDSFDITLGLDRSWVFDCPCCATGLGGESPDEAEVEETKKVGDTLHHVCVILQGDAWREQNSTVDMLVVRCMDQAENVFERVGCLRLSHDQIGRGYSNKYDPAPIHEEFDAIGWERRVMKLV